MSRSERQKEFNKALVEHLESLPLAGKYGDIKFRKTKSEIMLAMGNFYGDFDRLWSAATGRGRRGSIRGRKIQQSRHCKWSAISMEKKWMLQREEGKRKKRWNHALACVARDAGYAVVDASEGDWLELAKEKRLLYRYIRDLGPESFDEQGEPSDLDLLAWSIKG